MVRDQAALDSAPQAKPAGPCAMVIFGAAGDLTKRLVVPALYNLAKGKLLPENFALIGVDHNECTSDQWRQSLSEMMQSFLAGGGEFQPKSIDADAWNGLLAKMTFLQGDFNEAATFTKLGGVLDKIERDHGTGGNVLFYLAVSDRFFGPVAEQVAKAGLADEADGKRWRHIIVEKPFGHDVDSAKALNARLLKVWGEKQIYRIDHFLGKETVQNIMALRFANGFFEPVWNRDHIDHVQITAAETVGVEHRGKFYEQTGALRDMVPNHLFQLLTMTAMEPPTGFDCDSVRDRKADVLRAIRPASPGLRRARTIRQGRSAGRSRSTNYRQEPDVAANSPIETYVAMKLEIDTWRWAGVPSIFAPASR